MVVNLDGLVAVAVVVVVAVAVVEKVLNNAVGPVIETVMKVEAVAVVVAVIALDIDCNTQHWMQLNSDDELLIVVAEKAGMAATFQALMIVSIM